jgi:hypothetical protein
MNRSIADIWRAVAQSTLVWENKLAALTNSSLALLTSNQSTASCSDLKRNSGKDDISRPARLNISTAAPRHNVVGRRVEVCAVNTPFVASNSAQATALSWITCSDRETQ